MRTIITELNLPDSFDNDIIPELTIDDVLKYDSVGYRVICDIRPGNASPKLELLFSALRDFMTSDEPANLGLSAVTLRLLSDTLRAISERASDHHESNR